MAAKPQLHVKLSAKDAASLRKIAKAEGKTLSDTVRALVRRAAAQMTLPWPT